MPIIPNPTPHGQANAERRMFDRLRRRILRSVPQQIIRTSGDVASASTTYVDVTGMSLSVPASPGDKIEIQVSGRWTAAAITKRLDAQVVASSTYCSGGTGSTTGVAAWGGSSGVVNQFGGGILYTAAMADIAGGKIAIKLRMKMSGATSGTLEATDPPLHFWIKNHGA